MKFFFQFSINFIDNKMTVLVNFAKYFINLPKYIYEVCYKLSASYNNNNL